MTITLGNIKDTFVPEGLSNGGEVVIKCSMCETPLGIVLITRPHEKDPLNREKVLETKVKIKCYQCKDDGSFPILIKGGYHIGGYHKKIKDEPDNVIEKTVVEYEDIVGDVSIFKSRKVGE